MGQNSSADWDAYQHCPASDALVTVSAMSRTMEALGSWMSSNRLRLNMYIYIYIYITEDVGGTSCMGLFINNLHVCNISNCHRCSRPTELQTKYEWMLLNERNLTETQPHTFYRQL